MSAQQNKKSSLTAANLDTFCYISDIDSNELLYLSENACRAFGVMNSYAGKKCYQVLQNRNSPCEFCDKDKLIAVKSDTWEQYNQYLNRWLMIKSMLAEYGSNRIRIDFVYNVGEVDTAVDDMGNDNEAKTTLMECINTLAEDSKNALNTLLMNVCNYYQADSAYVFEMDSRARNLNEVYEWVRPGLPSRKQHIKELDIRYIKQWLLILRKDKFFLADFTDPSYQRLSDGYDFLRSVAINRAIGVPLRAKDDDVVGFIGITNPHQHIRDAGLLTSLSFFILNYLTRKQKDKKIHILHNTDSLTGLSNRYKYMDVVARFEANPPSSLGIVFANINGLREINNTYGQSHGDRLIIANAGLLQQVFDKDVYRFGGDEFVALCPNLSKDEFMNLIEELRIKIAADNDCSMSFGYAYRQGDYNIVREINYAEELMTIEKQSYYKSAAEHGQVYKSGEIQALFRDLKSNLFRVYLQPKVDLKSGKFNGAEALIRKFNPDGTALIPPYKFVPIYEREKIIRHVDLFVLETVCQTLQEWIKVGHALPVSVNLSRITFSEHNIIRDMLDICNKYDIPLSLIDVEITETDNHVANQELKEKMQALKAAGFSVSLDDFGTDYSNLLILTAVDFNQIKFDTSLVEKICEDKRYQAILTHAIGMCNDLKIEDVLAEGIETPEQRDLLIEMGCKSGQGYLFARPIPIPDFYELLKKQF